MEDQKIEEGTKLLLPRSITLDNINDFGDELNDKCKKCQKGGVIELDFSQLKMICSLGLGKIFAARNLMAEKSGRIRLIKVKDDYIKKLIFFMQLDRIFEVEEG